MVERPAEFEAAAACVERCDGLIECLRGILPSLLRRENLSLHATGEGLGIERACFTGQV